MANTVQAGGNAPVTSNKWAVVKQELLNDPSAYDRLQIPCFLCTATISTDPFAHGIPGTCPGMDIMACGHIMGHGCRVDWWNRGFTSCPICQSELAHAECRHAAVGRPLRSYEDVYTIPLTKDEGGKVEETCALCEIHLDLNSLPDKLPRFIGGSARTLAVKNIIALRFETSEGRVRNIWYEFSGPDYSVVTEDFRRTHNPRHVLILDAPAQIEISHAAQNVLWSRHGSWGPDSVSIRVGIEDVMTETELSAAGFLVEDINFA